MAAEHPFQHVLQRFLYLSENTPATGARALVEAYRLYLEQSSVGVAPGARDKGPVLSFTRAWTLVRFFDSGMVQLSSCQNCQGRFVAHAHDPDIDFVCAICKPPPRAGKTRARGKAKANANAKANVSAKANAGAKANASAKASASTTARVNADADA